MNRNRQAQYRESTGRTPVMTIMQRWWAFGGVPGTFFFLFFLVFGGWVVALPIAAGWFGVVFMYPLVIRFLTNTVMDAANVGNPVYKEWRDKGGDPYCDVQGFPVNFDSTGQRLGIPTDLPEETYEEPPPRRRRRRRLPVAMPVAPPPAYEEPVYEEPTHEPESSSAGSFPCLPTPEEMQEIVDDINNHLNRHLNNTADDPSVHKGRTL